MENKTLCYEIIYQKKKKNESEKAGRSLEINTKRRIDSFFMYVFTYAWEGIYEGTSR